MSRPDVTLPGELAAELASILEDEVRHASEHHETERTMQQAAARIRRQQAATTGKPLPVDPERIDPDAYLGNAERLPREEQDSDSVGFERVPVYKHPDCEPYMDDVTYNVPGVRPDGSVVEFVYILEGCYDPEQDAYIWTD